MQNTHKQNPNMNTDETKNIVLATGGTGGHVFPAHALAEELQQRGYNIVVITDQRYKHYVKEYDIQNTYFIQSASSYRCFWQKFTSIVKMTIGCLSAIKILHKLKPALVVGFGGYPSFPTMMAARLLRIPCILHEQNSVLGKTNKFFMNYATKIATSFPETCGISDPNKNIVTGNPVRAAIKSISGITYNSFCPPDDHLNIFVIGGSQGASILSKVVPEAIAKLPTKFRNKIYITQQCRAEDLEETKQRYEELGINAVLSSFFSDVPHKLSQTHLVISRAGASSIAELSVAGRPAILVPYPYSASNHQLHNATAFAESNKGWVIPQDIFNAATLSEQLEKFFEQPEIIANAAACAAKDPYPDAASKLADLVDEVVKR